MQTFYECAKAFLESDKTKTKWICDYGDIEFFVDGDNLLVYVVEIKESEQRKGHFTKFIHDLIQSDVETIGVVGVTSWEMYNCLHKMMQNGIPFVDHGGDFMLQRVI